MEQFGRWAVSDNHLHHAVGKIFVGDNSMIASQRYVRCIDSDFVAQTKIMESCTATSAGR